MLPDDSGLAANDDAAPSSRLDGELGYGLAVFGGGFTGTPNVGFGLSDTAREVRMGWRLTPARGSGSGSGDLPEHLAGDMDLAGRAPPVSGSGRSRMTCDGLS